MSSIAPGLASRASTMTAVFPRSIAALIEETVPDLRIAIPPSLIALLPTSLIDRRVQIRRGIDGFARLRHGPGLREDRSALFARRHMGWEPNSSRRVDGFRALSDPRPRRRHLRRRVVDQSRVRHWQVRPSRPKRLWPKVMMVMVRGSTARLDPRSLPVLPLQGP